MGKTKTFLRTQRIMQHIKVKYITAVVEECKPPYRWCCRANSCIGLMYVQYFKNIYVFNGFHRPWVSGFTLNLVLLQLSLFCFLKLSIKDSLVKYHLVLKKKIVRELNKEPGVHCVCSRRTVRPCLQTAVCPLLCYNCPLAVESRTCLIDGRQQKAGLRGTYIIR